MIWSEQFSTDRNRFTPPQTFMIRGVECMVTFQTQVGLMIDYARTLGYTELIFPFDGETEKQIVRQVAAAYRKLGFELKLSFPRG